MMKLCTNCYAVYDCDYPMDCCANLLCKEKTVLIDPVSVLILAKLQNICIFYNLKQTVMLAGTLNFYDIRVGFPYEAERNRFLEKCEELCEEERYAGKIAFDEYEIERGYFCLDIGIAGCYDDFVGLESMVKVERIFTLLMFLCELCDIPTDGEALAAFVESELSDQVVTTVKFPRWAPS